MVLVVFRVAFAGLSHRAGGFESLQNVAKQFHAMDRNKSESLDKREFDDALDTFFRSE